MLRQFSLFPVAAWALSTSGVEDAMSRTKMASVHLFSVNRLKFDDMKKIRKTSQNSLREFCVAF
jgi:hypothetical protein